MNFKVPDKKNKGEFISLLSNITGLAAAGRICAIMGPSGAGNKKTKPKKKANIKKTKKGKSTLLDVIAGRMDPQKSILEGEMMVNGKPREKNWKGISGYVLQDDVKEKKKKKF